MNKVEHDSATPAHGQQVISACVLVHRKVDGVVKVFLPKRADTKEFLPGIYELPGGHIDFGEDIVDGLKREIKEELNMSVSIGDPFACFTYTNNVKGSHSIETVYFGQFSDPLENITLHPEDHSEYGWFSRDEVLGIRSEFLPSPEDNSTSDEDDDIEYKNVLKGLDLLEGSELSFK